MEFIYVFLCGNEWEDATIFLSKDDAIRESIKYPKERVEIFSKTETSGYTPTYNCYKNGEFVINT